MDKNELRTAAESLKRLFGCFPVAGPVDVDAQAEAYLWAVKDYEVADIVRACHRFTQGEVEGFNGAFCPSTAQLCQEIRARREIRLILEKRPSGGVVPLNPGSAFLRQYEAERQQANRKEG